MGLIDLSLERASKGCCDPCDEPASLSEHYIQCVGDGPATDVSVQGLKRLSANYDPVQILNGA